MNMVGKAGATRELAGRDSVEARFWIGNKGTDAERFGSPARGHLRVEDDLSSILAHVFH
jgi:hypothetical protein